MVGVRGPYHLRRRVVERGASVGLLAPGILVPRCIGLRPERRWGAGRTAVDITAEDDAMAYRLARQDRPQFGALRIVGSYLGRIRGGEVRGAHRDAASRGDA